MHTKIVNMFGGPSVGKSTTSAFLFYTLKKLGKSVELVTEYAKDLVYQEDWKRLGNQLHILDEQIARQNVALGKVDFIVTDSPILLTVVYNTGPPALNNLALEKFRSYYNINFFLVRSKPYQTYGRTQTEEEAVRIDNKIYGLLTDLGIPFNIIKSEEEILPCLFQL